MSLDAVGGRRSVWGDCSYDFRSCFRVGFRTFPILRVKRFTRFFQYDGQPGSNRAMESLARKRLRATWCWWHLQN